MNPYNKKIRIFLKSQAKQNYLCLKKKNDKRSRTILDSIRRIRDILKDNPQYGRPMSKRLIPADFDISNMYRIELPGFWRMLYTIEGDGIEIFIFILHISDHKDYDRLLGYKS